MLNFWSPLCVVSASAPGYYGSASYKETVASNEPEARPPVLEVTLILALSVRSSIQASLCVDTIYALLDISNSLQDKLREAIYNRVREICDGTGIGNEPKARLSTLRMSLMLAPSLWSSIQGSVCI